MKVLFCTALEPTKANGATIYTIRVLRALHSLGHDVKVCMIQFYSATDSPRREEWVPGLRELQEIGVIFEVYPARPKLSSFAAAYIRLAREFLVSMRNIDVFAFRLAYFQPFCAIAKIARSSVATSWFHDGIVEEIYFVHPDSKHRGLMHLFEFFEKCGSRFIDWEFPVSEKMRDYSRRKGIHGRKGSIVLPCVVELDRFYLRPAPKNSSNDVVVVGFAGSLAPWQGFEDACRFLQYLSRFMAVKLHVLTSEIEKAKSTAAHYQLDALLEWTQHENVPQKMDQWDFALAPQRAGLRTQVCSPLKATEALSKGIPLIIAPEVGDFSELVKRHGIGIVFNPDNSDDWYGAVDNIKQILNNYQAVSLRARNLAGEFYAWDILSQRIAEALRGENAMKKFSKHWYRASLYIRLMKHWGGMLLGKSYWHAQQGLGRQFVPGQLLGYYNDLTAKTNWTGPVDDNGLPLNQLSNGNFIHFPTTLLQKALGHWDRWLESKQADSNERTAFLKLAEWCLRSQDANGGWAIWPVLGLSYASPYSAMTQGEAVSVLVRAASFNQNERYREAAKRALELMFSAIGGGGVCRSATEGLVLEEAPLVPHNTLLNGWVFALYGLYDYLLMAKVWQEDTEWVEAGLRDSLHALLAYMPQFNAGFWSYYDTSGNLASPFYHQLHIAQLKALEITFTEYADEIGRWRQLFEQQADSRLNKVRAVVLKAYQKLRRPPEVVLR